MRFAGEASDDGPRGPLPVHASDGAPGGVEVDGIIHRGDPDDDRQHRQLVGPLHSLRGMPVPGIQQHNLWHC